MQPKGLMSLIYSTFALYNKINVYLQSYCLSRVCSQSFTLKKLPADKGFSCQVIIQNTTINTSILLIVFCYLTKSGREYPKIFFLNVRYTCT